MLRHNCADQGFLIFGQIADVPERPVLPKQVLHGRPVPLRLHGKPPPGVKDQFHGLDLHRRVFQAVEVRGKIEGAYIPPGIFTVPASLS